MLQHAILMNSRLVCKSVGADHGLVRLHRITGNGRNEFRRRHNLGGVNTCLDVEIILPGAQRHHDFFQRCITGTLPQTVDGAFHLSRARFYGRERIGNGHAEIIVAMGRPYDLVRIGDAFKQCAESFRP